MDAGRTRRAGGGRKRIVDTDPTLVSDLDALLEPITAGEPDDSPLRWTSKSVSKLTAELQALGHPVGHRVVNELLHPPPADVASNPVHGQQRVAVTRHHGSDG